VIAFLQVAQRSGAVVEVVDDDEHGQFSVADLRNRIENGTGEAKLVAMTHVPTQGGLVNPAEEVEYALSWGLDVTGTRVAELAETLRSRLRDSTG
jgi:cysteine desulfurase / selenocysteine lyase